MRHGLPGVLAANGLTGDADQHSNQRPAAWQGLAHLHGVEFRADRPAPIALRGLDLPVQRQKPGHLPDTLVVRKRRAVGPYRRLHIGILKSLMQ